MKYILALDQGTTSSRAIVFNEDGAAVSVAQREIRQIYPKPGWVEHDPKEIFESQRDVAREALERADIGSAEIVAAGITNQRETAILWDRQSGEPLHNAIVWQDRRTAAKCAELRESGVENIIKNKTGLVLDPYFSGTKIAWMLDNIPGARAKAERGELAFGTVDTWLAWNLSQSRLHVTDPSNASRTMLFDIHRGDWDEELLQILRVPRAILPDVLASSGAFGMIAPEMLGEAVTIAGIAGDQQAALFGQACFAEGDVKCTYGTGAFALMNVGTTPTKSKHGLVTTVAWQIDGKTTYALEGSAFIAGAAVQWLRDGLGIIRNAADIEALARKVDSSDGVAFVPALAGLGAPYWDQGARGTITGITRGTTAAHLARATLEGIAFEVWDLVQAMTADAGRPLNVMKIDGGAARNDLLAQFQADVAAVEVVRPTEIESTGRGAAMLAGVGAGLADLGTAARMVKLDRSFRPAISVDDRAAHLRRWEQAVLRTRSSAG